MNEQIAILHRTPSPHDDGRRPVGAAFERPRAARSPDEFPGLT